MKSWMIGLVGLVVCGCATHTFESAQMPAGELLSVHCTKSRYVGTEIIPCRFMTAECPARCEHGGTYAKFMVLEYTNHQNPTGRGDGKQSIFYARVEHKDGSPDLGLPEPLRKVVLQLTPGQEVTLDWVHVYCQDEAGSRWPARPVTRLSE